MNKKRFSFSVLLFVVLAGRGASNDAEYELVKTEAIDSVWSGNYVGFSLLTSDVHQYVGYYDANRQLTVAYRRGRLPWNYYKLDSWYGWDSHNSIQMELDSTGRLHVMGNMHAEPLEYFRTAEPYRVRSLRRIDTLGNPEIEKHVTYPRFMKDKAGSLILKYRSGFSGDGRDIYLRYDPDEMTWSRLHNTALLDGQGEMNAYAMGPALGPDGYFHLVWVWRDTPDAATNHDLSYARSLDLVHWEDSNGRPVELPLSPTNSEVVDPIPPRGGLLNGGLRLGFDRLDRAVIAYHKYDENGYTQVYLARKKGAAWVSTKISNWDGYRWDFGGTGSLSSREVSFGAVEHSGEGLLSVQVTRQGRPMSLIVREDDFQLVSVEPAHAYPPVLSRVASSPSVAIDGAEPETSDGLIFKVMGDSGSGGTGSSRYYLSWESQAPYRGQARDRILPPSTLYLHELRRSAE